ncbi:putative inner membrane protein [Botrimarina colliarenosi]|uniref:Putative inner membrane protein n=1 Tax=Botrimarina colliarenosi TaxID=2528001 RepID=A0A5C6AFQ4_9BACT|nr:AI-2E family transporter [Botrimarina colliarenosi]TWT98138.1 putative inner membrane protein [Botrimarina colliarenosi]
MPKAKPSAPTTKEKPTPSADEPSVAPTESSMLRGLPRVISLLVLMAVVLLIGVMFFRVMASFLVPLFLAAVLAVIFKPLHSWLLAKLNGRNQLAALATTTLIALGVVAPTALLGWMAYVETARIVRVTLAAATPDETTAEESTDEGEGAEDAAAQPKLILPEGAENEPGASDEDAPAAGWTAALMARLEPLTEWYHENVNAEFDPSKLAQTAAQYAVKIGLVGVQSLLGFVIGTGIMIFALYYFFADGPTIVETLMHLSPLDDDYERELLDQFARVSRAVVLATLLAAFVQGILGGIGYFFVVSEWTPATVLAEYGGILKNVPDEMRIHPPVFLLTVLTMTLAIVPFVGATAVWLPVALWVYFVQGDFWPAIGLAIYGFAVVSSIDNLIKPLVLHGQSNLHPLLALLSVLGGLQLLGPIGILVGPMLVAFLQALLLMLRKELDVLAKENGETQTAPA